MKFLKTKKSPHKYIIIIMMIACFSLLFFTVDFIRVQQQQLPIFCIHLSISDIADGGTKIYWGLGYKVIAYNKAFFSETGENIGYQKIHIGSWFMQYDDSL